MAENSIDLVRKAEQEAEEAHRTALRRAQEIAEEAKKEAARIAADADDAARASAAAGVEKAQAESTKELAEAGSGLDAEMEQLAARAREKQPEAVEMILGALV